MKLLISSIATLILLSFATPALADHQNSICLRNCRLTDFRRTRIELNRRSRCISSATNTFNACKSRCHARRNPILCFDNCYRGKTQARARCQRTYNASLRSIRSSRIRCLRTCPERMRKKSKYKLKLKKKLRKKFRKLKKKS